VDLVSSSWLARVSDSPWVQPAGITPSTPGASARATGVNIVTPVAVAQGSRLRICPVSEALRCHTKASALTYNLPDATPSIQ